MSAGLLKEPDMRDGASLLGSGIENATSAQPKNLASAPRLSPLRSFGGVAGDETIAEREARQVIESHYQQYGGGGEGFNVISNNKLM